MPDETRGNALNSETTTPNNATEGPRIELDRSKLLGFDQANETSEPGKIGAHLSAKIGDKPGIKPR
jgi:hypothetical protein